MTGRSAAEDVTSQLVLPPGFRFFPTDEELLVHYLCPKVAGQHFGLQIIADVDLYKFDPWVLPNKALFGEREWYFFSPRDRKYPNGSRPNRVAGSGYWKATGTDKVVTTGGRKVGVKKALVFYAGKAPKGSKTNWIMHEYRLFATTLKKGSLRLDDWVLCRIYEKSSGAQASPSVQDSSVPCTSPSYLDDVLDSLPDIDDHFSLPRVNSLKSLQDFKPTHQTVIPGSFNSACHRLETGQFGQNSHLAGEFCFPTALQVCQAESPSEMLSSSIEDEVESAIKSGQNTDHQPMVFSRPLPELDWLFFGGGCVVDVVCGGFGGRG